MGKDLLVRIVAMRTRMIGAPDHVRESEAVYEYEYGEAEQGHALDAQTNEHAS